MQDNTTTTTYVRTSISHDLRHSISTSSQLYLHLQATLLLLSKPSPRSLFPSIATPQVSSLPHPLPLLSPSLLRILPLSDSLVDLCCRGATMKFESPIGIPGTRLTVVNSCTGLICLSDFYCQNNVYVCNPVTREHFRLPESKNEPSVINERPQRYCFLYGLGYSRSADHFKVLKFTVNLEMPFERYCSIYTLGVDDEWRTLGDPGLPFPRRSPFVFLNGALHWLGWENSFHPSLCYFDMEKERCGNLPLPSQFSGYGFRLGVVDNCLYVGKKTKSSGPVNIWVMKDYENIGSWTLEWIIQKPLPSGLYWDLSPIMTLEDGTVLIIDENKTLASYNPVSRVLEKIRYHGVNDWNEAIVGLPSFLPLPGAV